MVENWNISENRGGAEVFLEIASIAQFLSEIKNEGIKLFRRAIPFYPDPKKLVSTTLGGGSPSIYVSFVFHQTKMDTFSWYLWTIKQRWTPLPDIAMVSVSPTYSFRYPQAPPTPTLGAVIPASKLLSRLWSHGRLWPSCQICRHNYRTIYNGFLRLTNILRIMT